MMELFRKSVNASREALAKVEVREELTDHYAIVRVYSKMLVTSCAIYTLLINTDSFVSFFFEDPDAIGHMGYAESWKYVMDGSHSVRRFTNIDCLIRRLMEE